LMALLFAYFLPYTSLLLLLRQRNSNTKALKTARSICCRLRNTL
jgi:hypothetical protein